MVLPIVFTHTNKWKVFVLVLSFIWFLYLVTNHFHLRDPQLLSLSWIDKNVAFVPDSVWIYITYFLIFSLAYHYEKDLIYLHKFLYAIVAINFVSNLFFLCAPVAYAQRQLALPEDVEGLTRFCYQIIYWIDPPTNCYPSLHVSMAFISALLWYKRNQILFILFFLWASLIAFSTLTTKQHYAADIAGGFCLAVGAYYYFFCKLKFADPS